VFGIGGGVGLVLSGVIVEHLGWHWLFLVGALPPLAAAALVARLVPESPMRTRARARHAGAAALTAGFAVFLLALSQGDVRGWASPGVLGLLAAPR
jgi:MFS family permease